MIRTVFFFLFLTVLLPIHFYATEPNVHYSLHKEVITVNSLEAGYTSSVYCRGKFTSLIGRETAIPYTELEALGGIRARYRNERGKYKDLPEENIHNSAMMGSSFYSGMNKYVLSWPSKGEEELTFLYSYKLNCKELMTLSILPTNGVERTDTFDYDIRIPPGILLYYKIPEGMKGLKADSAQVDGGWNYHFVSCPEMPLHPAEHLEEYESNDFPPNAVRLILVPQTYAHKPWQWLNDWYRNALKDNPALNTASKEKFDQLLQGTSDPDTIASRIFDYVKKRITYLDVENGMGAFIPRSANLVLLNCQGDCKDMANLLFEGLKTHGIEVYHALSSTLSHDLPLDFPSLSSANHLICVAHIRDQWRYLDATESVCKYGYPSMQIQGRTIFLITDSGGVLQHVPEVSADQNKSFFTASLSPIGNDLSGTFNYTFHGLSRIDAQQINYSASAADFVTITTGILEKNTRSTQFSKLSCSENDSTTVLAGKLKVVNKLSYVLGKNTLSLQFLPFPHKFPRQRDKGTQIITYLQEDNVYTCTLELDKPIRLAPVQPVTYLKDGFSFRFSVKQSGTQTIQIQYEYVHADVRITPDKADAFFEMNELIDQTFNQLLIYENQ